MDEYQNDQDLKNVIFKRVGKKYCIYNRSPYKNTYEKYTFCFKNMKSPFGIEKYNYKEIVNFEFTGHRKNNEMLNQVNSIKQLDNFIKNIQDMELNNSKCVSMCEDIEEKQYLSCIRDRNGFDPLIRLHLKKKAKNILTEIYFKQNSSTSIKDKMCNVKFEVGDVWINDYGYGLILYISEIEVLN